MANYYIENGNVQLPRHAHDCDCCVFVGTEGEFDLWWCTGQKTPIARYGNAGQYKSGFCFIGRDPLLKKAYDNAVKKGVATKYNTEAALSAVNIEVISV